MTIIPVLTSFKESYIGPAGTTSCLVFCDRIFTRRNLYLLSLDFLTLQMLIQTISCVLCCQEIEPSRGQCTILHTMARDAVFPASKMIDLAMVIWLISSVLFIILAVVLLYGCLRMWCKKCKNTSNGPGTSEHISGHAGNAHSWHGVDIETTQINEFPTLIVTDVSRERHPYTTGWNNVSALPQTGHS